MHEVRSHFSRQLRSRLGFSKFRYRLHNEFNEAVAQLAVFIGVLIVATQAHGQDTIFAYQGISTGNRVGESVGRAGDVNQDGYQDVAIGVPDSGNRPGYVFVQSGRDGSTLFAFSGDSPGDNFGISISGSGDVNGDGYPDIVAGATAGGPYRTGYVRVHSGWNGEILYSFSHPSSHVREFGWKVSRAGDVNRDGHDDVIVGTIKEWADSIPEAGRVRVFSGASGELRFGRSYSGFRQWLRQR
jgi:hypothetical protein